MLKILRIVSALPVYLLQRLGLATVRKERATFADESEADVVVTEMVGIDIQSRRTTEEIWWEAVRLSSARRS